jgi:hypothetical protein
MTFFARKPALVRTIKPAMKQMQRVLDCQTLKLRNWGLQPIASPAVTRPDRLQDQQHRDIDRQDDESPPISVVFTNSAIALIWVSAIIGAAIRTPA